MRLSAATSYSYRVRAADGSGNLSGYSSVQSATAQSAVSNLVAAYSFNEAVEPLSSTGPVGATRERSQPPRGHSAGGSGLLSFNGTETPSSRSATRRRCA